MTKKRKPYLSPVPAGDSRLNDVDRPFNAKTVERVVDNPFSAVGGKIVVTVSTRDDPFEAMRARRQLDDCQYMVGLKLRDWFVVAELGDIRAMDPTKEPVDGRGATAEPRTDAQMRATDKLSAGRAATGKHGWGLVCAVLRDRVSLLDRKSVV